MKEYQHPDIQALSLVKVMQALSDPCRLSIMRALIKEGELACNELPVAVAKATLSHHMAVLREAGLIRTRVEGTKCMNTVRAETLARRFPGLFELIAPKG